MNKLILLSLITLVLLQLFSPSNGRIIDCSGPKAVGKLESISVSDCDLENKPVCNFIRGTNKTLNVELKSLASFNSAKIELYGKLGPVPIPFPINPNEACGNYGLKCPVQANQENLVTVTLPILKSYPKLQVTVQFKMLDEHRNPIVCFEFPAKIL